jgi:hypothetical protein
MSIHYGIENLRYQATPLYYQYPHRSGPQNAYLEMSENGFVTAGWDAETDDSIPMYVQNRECFRWTLSPNADGESLYGFLRSDRMRSLLERVHKGHRVEQDGYRWIGNLTRDAHKASLEIESILNEKPYLERKVYHVKDWLESRFSADDVVATSHIDAYVQNVYNEAMNLQQSECVAFFGSWGDAVERLCLDRVDRAMRTGDGPDGSIRRLAQMLADYDRDNHGDLPEQYDIHFDDALPFNRDGGFDDMAPASRTSERTNVGE